MSGPGDREEDPDTTDFLSALRPGGGCSRDDHTSSGEPPANQSLDELDPDVAIVESERRPPRLPPPVIDTRRYQFIIGGVGLTIFLLVSILLLLNSKSGTPGYAPGQKMHEFVAPLAISDLANVATNAHPVCDPARPSRRGLNVCDRGPIVLDFFALTGTTSACVKEVTAMQQVSRRFPSLRFAAVALNADKAATAKLVRQEGWTIPIAYDLTDTLGQVYGVEVCPMVEIAKTGGVVVKRLIGNYYATPQHLAAAVATAVAKFHDRTAASSHPAGG